MSGNVYTAIFQDVEISAVQDLFELLVPSDAVVELLELSFGQSSIAADAGDAQEEFLLTTLRMVSGAPTSGSGGSTATPRPSNLGAVASGCTAEINNTTQLSGGTNVVLDVIPVNIRMPERKIDIPEGRYYFSPSIRLLWELEDAPTDAVTCCGSIKWRELGG